ncbi:aldo/keto reductase [bacterium]|nr:aldo/keto reductase [bacterium]
MPAFLSRVTLGRSGLSVGPLGIAGGYGVGYRGLFKAFDAGVNYWYHGSRRAGGMSAAIRDLCAAGHRSDLVIVLQSYSRSGALLTATTQFGMKRLAIEQLDVLLLGWFDRPPPARVLDAARDLREKGLVRHIAISSHNRPRFLEYAGIDDIDILHVRYNAAHTGAENEVFSHLPAPRPGVVSYTNTRWGHLLKSRLMPDGETPMRGRDCYRFAMSHPSVDVAIAGPSNADELDEALAALVEGPILPDEEERFRRIGSHVRAHGPVRTRPFWSGA